MNKYGSNNPFQESVLHWSKENSYLMAIFRLLAYETAQGLLIFQNGTPWSTFLRGKLPKAQHFHYTIHLTPTYLVQAMEKWAVNKDPLPTVECSTSTPLEWRRSPLLPAPCPVSGGPFWMWRWSRLEPRNRLFRDLILGLSLGKRTRSAGDDDLGLW